MTVTLIETTVDRGVLDTFDLWTRFEMLPRTRRCDLLGDAGAVRRRQADDLPPFTPSAITVVEGRDAYTGTVWVRRGDVGDGSSVVVVAVDRVERIDVAARDLARFVEFVLMDGLDRELDRELQAGLGAGFDVALGRIDGLSERGAGH